MLYNVLEKLASKLEIKGLPLVILFLVSYVTVLLIFCFFSRILPKDQGR